VPRAGGAPAGESAAQNAFAKRRFHGYHRAKSSLANRFAASSVPMNAPAPARNRTAQVARVTTETEITLAVDLDGGGAARLDTGVPFLEHMLDQVARHGVIDLDIKAKGDLHIDDHHTVEDIGITLGQAVRQALGDKAGVRRYGHSYVPLDEALSRVVIDFSGRPLLTMNAAFPDALIGRFATALIHEFFQGFCNHAQVTLHIDSLRGANSHHIAETMFKAFGRALRMAVEIDPRMTGVPSTKGQL